MFFRERNRRFWSGSSDIREGHAPKSPPNFSISCLRFPFAILDGGKLAMSSAFKTVESEWSTTSDNPFGANFGGDDSFVAFDAFSGAIPVPG